MLKEVGKILLQKTTEILPKMTKEQQKQFFSWLSIVFLIFMMGKTIYEQNKLIQAYENSLTNYKHFLENYNKQMDYKLLQISDELNVIKKIIKMKDPNLAKEIEKYYTERQKNRK